MRSPLQLRRTPWDRHTFVRRVDPAAASSWAGLCDLSPDYSPILGRTEVENFHVSAGWGTYGFKAAPIVGKTLAELVHSGRTPELIAPFALERFYEDRLVSELAAAAVSH
jgi:sarcosine oxidase subunit beta